MNRVIQRLMLAITFFVVGQVLAQDSLNMRKIFSFPSYQYNGSDVSLKDSLCFLANERNLLVLDSRNPYNIQLISIFSAQEWAGNCNSIVVSDSIAFVSNGTAGYSIVNIQNPASLRLISFRSVGAYVRDIFLRDSLIFVSSNSGLSIWNVRDLASPQLLSEYLCGTSYRMILVGTTAFLANGTSGVRVLDVSNPRLPTLINTIPTSGQTLGVDYNHGVLCTAEDANGIRIFNVENLNNIYQLGIYRLSGISVRVKLLDTHIIVSNQTWGVSIVDYSSPSNLIVTGYYNTSSAVCGFETLNDYVFVSDGQFGLIIFDTGLLFHPAMNTNLNEIFFSSTEIHTTDSTLLTIANPRNTAFTYSTRTGANGPNFTHRVLDNDSTTNAGDSLRIMVYFTPDSTKSYADTLRLTFEAPYLPVTLPLSGTGVGTYAYRLTNSVAYPATEPTRYDSAQVLIRIAGNRPFVLGTSFQPVDAPPFYWGTLPDTTQPGDTLRAWLYFMPETQGNFSGSPYLLTTAINTDTLRVTATGRSAYIPAPPGNLTITRSGEDMQLNWARVDTSINGVPLTVTRYLISYRDDPAEPWQYLWYTSGSVTTFLHPGVVSFSPAMFYQVRAWIGDTDSFDRAIRELPVGTPEATLIQRLAGQLSPPISLE